MIAISTTDEIAVMILPNNKARIVKNSMMLTKKPVLEIKIFGAQQEADTFIAEHSLINEEANSEPELPEPLEPKQTKHH